MGVPRSKLKLLLAGLAAAAVCTGAALAIPCLASRFSADRKLEQLAREAARRGPLVLMAPLASDNPQLGRKQLIANPLADYRFWCVLRGYGPAAPDRAYICVSRSGVVRYPFHAEREFGTLLAAEDTSGWKDRHFLQAAALYVHLTADTNQDGWRLLQGPPDFLAVTVTGAEPVSRRDLAAAITAPRVERRDGKVTVTFWTWHYLGGRLRAWSVEFDPEFKAARKELGSFGGGAYQ